MYKYLYWILLSIITLSACQNNEKVIPAPEIFLQIPDGGFDFDTDSVEYIEPKITYDIDSEYTWSENDLAIDNEKIYTFENRPLGTYLLKFTVFTPYGEDAMDISVNSLDINSFEEFDNLNDDGYFNQPEEGFHQFKYIHYSCDYDAASPADWGGFALSDNTNKTDASEKNEFSVYASSGADDSDIFMVYKQQADKSFPVTFNDGNAHVVRSIEVNNATRSYLTMQSGFNKKEGKDYYLLSISGLDQNGAKISGPVEFLLADYRPELTADKYLVSEWEQVDLTSLGAIHQLVFELSSSRDADETFDLPMYFCLDNLKIIE
ncbi:DUF4465 domain-containing protein [Carboxylicivirga sediminis]|uniref:DUF4465 domain-containing protein n=1 Tax=Carboxylicivirga sediminis TaxID=2006564 RepID=A0A941IZN6_9BACT|nr:DUF4465 domain-containing protein [Carboxylicivirga sediminis]MBR8537598.1 DUF4465 domain-containing protein [Carboxylicivirga sediminis]